jgi:putative transposase
VAFVSEQFRLSERTACKLLGVERSSYRYDPRPDRNAELRDALVQLARQKPRYGYRRLHALLCRRGHEAGAIQSCHAIRSGLDCQIQLSQAAW